MMSQTHSYNYQIRLSYHIDNTHLKGLAMCIATYTDVMDNPHYGARKLNPGLPFSAAIKNLSTYCFCTSTVPFHIVAYHG